MAWSKWRAALVLMLLASVGLAWSQTPMFNRSASSSERIMTVHENGKALRCRVIQTWRTGTGAQANQLQVLDTGEMITIVEDGSPTTVPTSVPGKRATALPMRIFHWGQRSRVAPAGAPLPPMQTIEPVASATQPLIVQTTAAQTVAATKPATTGSECKDGVAWEAATGKPVILLSNSSAVTPSASSGPVIIQGASSDCTIIETPRSASSPRILQPRTSGPVIISEKVISTTPVTTGAQNTVTPSLIGNRKAKPVETKPIDVKYDRNPLAIPASPKTTAEMAASSTKNVKPTTLPAPSKVEKTPFSTATAHSQPTPKTSPLVVPSKSTTAKKESTTEVAKNDSFDWRNVWGKQPDTKKQASRTERKKTDILMAPERFDPSAEKSKVPAELVQQFQQQSVPTPLGVQSVLSARNGAQGPVQYIPVPVATVPEPIRAPTPPAPNVPTPPNPTAFVNAFSPPPNPQGQPQLTPEQMQMMARHQALMQQQAFLQQQAMQQRMQQANTAQLVPVGYGMPTQVSYPANYSGPQPPNPVGQQRPMFPIQQVGYAPPASAGVNPAMERGVVPVAAQQPAVSNDNTLAQLIKVLQESPYPAQREWAAANLASFDWRVYPHLAQVLAQTARQDAAATVRAAAVCSLSRLNLHGEPVLGTLQALRGDADPQVRQEVEQAYIRLGMTATPK